jgi:hypothetical protein
MPSPGPGPGSAPPSSEYGAAGATVSESQLTSGLIELSIYGVVSLYEKYQPNAEAAAGTPPKQ